MPDNLNLAFTWWSIGLLAYRGDFERAWALALAPIAPKEPPCLPG